MNPYEEDTLIRHQIAEAQRDAARRQLLRDAAPANARTRPCAAKVSSLWLKRRNERMVPDDAEHHNGTSSASQARRVILDRRSSRRSNTRMPSSPVRPSTGCSAR
jgi:hypothetical protein